MHFIYLNDAIISVKNGAKTVVATDVSANLGHQVESAAEMYAALLALKPLALDMIADADETQLKHGISIDASVWRNVLAAIEKAEGVSE